MFGAYELARSPFLFSRSEQMTDVSYQFLPRADRDAQAWEKQWVSKLSPTSPMDLEGMQVTDVKELICKLWGVDRTSEIKVYKRYNGPRAVVEATEQQPADLLLFGEQSRMLA